MKWIKHVTIDLVVTVLIVIATTLGLVWAQWIVWIYTPIMLLLKAFAVANTTAVKQFNKKGDDVPTWFFHALYAVNVGFLLAYAWWITAGEWVLIWILSVVADVRARRPAGTKAKQKKGQK